MRRRTETIKQTGEQEGTETIKISVADFRRQNKGLITVLSAIGKAGSDGISTRKLYAQVGMIGYGDKLVDIAQKKGYIKRERRPPPSRRGFHPVHNILTPKGKKLLSQLEL